MPPNIAVKPGIWFVENTDSDTVSAITLVAYPELKALFRINIPFIDPVVIGQGKSLGGGIVEADGLSRTCLGALSANFAHLPDADFNGFFRNQR